MQNNTHLNEEQMAQCADALNNRAYDMLPKDIKVHLEACDLCASEVLSIAEISRHHHDMSIKSTLPKSHTTVNKSLWPLLAVAATVLIFVLFYFSGFLNPKDETPKVVVDLQKDTNDINLVENLENEHLVKTDVKDELNITDNKLLAVFEPNENLEKLFINMQGAYRSTIVKVETPAVFYPQAADTLRWQNPKDEKLYVEIFDNTEKAIINQKVHADKFSLPKLKNGLYYWKLINEEYDLLFLGKIIVE